MDVLNTCELKAARVRRGYSQKGLAETMGMNPAKYCLLEGNRQTMTLSDASVIARTLGMTGDEVLKIFFDGELHSNSINTETGVHGNTEQIYLDGCVVVYAMYSCCFWIEIRLFRCRAVNQKPAHRIGDGGFSETVRSVNVRVFAVEVDGKFLDSSEIREREAQNLHVVPPLGLEISMRFMYNLRRLFSRCFGRIPYGVRGLKRCSSGRKNLHGERLTLANAWVSRFSFAHKSFFVRRL